MCSCAQNRHDLWHEMAQLYKINADARKLCSYEMWLNDERIISQILYVQELLENRKG